MFFIFINNFFILNNISCQIFQDILSRLDDPCINVRILAIECLSQIEADQNDENFNESRDSNLAETVINRLFLYFDDPAIKIRPALLRKYC